MAGKTFPRYVKIGNGRPTFQPAWTKEMMVLCNAVITNVTDELLLSKTHHDSWRSQQTPEERNKWCEARRQGCKQMYFDRRQNQGWLDRKQIWNRACQRGAVGSLVVKISGMRLDVGPGGADRIKAANQVKAALIAGAAPQDGFPDSILDVVCSQAEAEDGGRTLGVSRVSCTFYIRIPAFLGLIAFDYWIPRINEHTICHCGVEAYLFYGDGKEPRGGPHAHDAWNVTVAGVTPSETGMDSRMVRTLIYNPDGAESKHLMNMALQHSQGQQRKAVIGDWFKDLKLADKHCVPACEDDMKKMEAGPTWSHWKMFSSGDPHQVWSALCSLRKAGEGEIRDEKWVMNNPGQSYRLFVPDRQGLKDHEAWNGGNGHLKLEVGEMALTFDEPISLHYWTNVGTKDEKCTPMWGLMALAVKIRPNFIIRECSTFHQLWAPQNVVGVVEYKLLNQAIVALHMTGMNYIFNSMGHTVISGSEARREGVPPVHRLLEPQHVVLPREHSLQAVFPQRVEVPLIELNQDLLGSIATPIPLPAGSPLSTLQVDTQAKERHVQRIKEITKFMTEEMKTYTALKTKESDPKEKDNLEIIKAEMDRSASTLELYDTMLAETEAQEGKLWSSNPGPDWVCEMRIRVGSTFGPSSDRAVQDAQQKVIETMQKSITELLADRQWDRVTPVTTP